MRSVVIFIVTLLLSCQAIGQFCRTPREYLFPNQAHYTRHYHNDSLIVLDELRKTTNFLSDYWLTEYDGIPLVKRKKAVVRHVKHLSEELEFQASLDREMTPEMESKLFELEYLRRSYLEKSSAELNNEVTRKDKVAMLKATLRSRSKMKFAVSSYKTQAGDSSYFWNPVHGKRYKQFGELADRKKIDTDALMIVIFDGLSHDGSAPKIKTKDTDLDNEWTLKWGDEVHTDVVGSRLFAALGYDVDHPYYFSGNELMLVLDSTSGVGSWQALHDSIQRIYDVDLMPFFQDELFVTPEMTSEYPKLKPYLGRNVLRFKECAIEARPDRVKRLGSFLPDELGNPLVEELNAALLAHVWIDNWDVREQNTLLTNVHEGNYVYHVSAVFSDLGTSLGVKLTPLRGDFKVGLVNQFSWTAARLKRGKVRLNGRINSWNMAYTLADYPELKWMASQIAQVDSLTLRKVLAKSGWPPALQELYFHKLASRRASILSAFAVKDPNPISFDRKLKVEVDGVVVIKNGKLKKRYQQHPEGLRGAKGRMRNYGN